jgi:hypothetical protein
MRMVRKTFRQGNARLGRILANPGMAERVAEIREAAAREDRIYALTQPQFARRLN